MQDCVQSYFGMRKISLGQVPGESNPRIMLNNQFIFQMGVLDQVGCLDTVLHGWTSYCLFQLQADFSTFLKQSVVNSKYQ